ncbi:Serine/threonine-protein kinase PknB [Phycisphaerae bacterium RAS1]|nr:Serine/threonine-protein kinase PknB [Phycisphaerae bacterium RAS1]
MATLPGHCPPPDALEAAAVGRETPEELREHLAACMTCRTVLERIREDNRFLSGFAVNGALPAVALPRETNYQIDVPGYEIVREIRRGGQGVVYQAVQRSTKRDVAIKVMRQGPFATLADRSRFDREVETLSKLDHPNIVTVHDAGVVAGFHYFVMNYIDGRPLDELPDWRSWTAAVGEPQDASSSDDSVIAAPLPPRKAAVAPLIRLFIKVCDAVHAAHLRGVIHRDLKPSNIRVDRSGEPFVLDFGLAKSVDAVADSAATRTGQFVGSLPWAAPEQVEGASSRIDLRTDVYSLGAILYQLLTGASPFDVGSNLRDAFDDILNREPRRPSAIVVASGAPRIDDELDTIVLKCLSKDRERRYQSAGELARDLRLYLAGEPIQAKSDSAMYVLRKTLKRYRYRVFAGSAFVLLLAVFSVVMAVLYRRSTVLEQQASSSAESLADLLSYSNVEQGRMSGMLGNLEQAEQLLWGELLTRRGPGQGTRLRLNDPPGPPEAYWALWELYRRRPCRMTLASPPGVVRNLTCDATGAHLWATVSGSSLEQLDLSGGCRERVDLGFDPGTRMSLPRAGGRAAIAPSSDGWSIWVRGGGAPVPLPRVSNTDDSAVSFSEDGARVAVVRDGEAIVMTLSPAGTLAQFSVGEAICAAALSPDGRRLAARDRVGGLYVWEIDGQRLVRRAAPSVRPREAALLFGPLLFSPNGRRLADGWAEIAGRIWNLDPDPPTATPLAEAPGGHRTLAFSPDSRLLAVGDLVGAVRIFDAESCACLDRFIAHAARIYSIGFTANPLCLWTAGTGEMRCWEVDRSAGVRTLRLAGDRLHTVDFTADGEALLAAGGLGTLYTFDVTSGALSATPVGDSATICAVAASPDGRRCAVATYGGAAYVWDSRLPVGPPIKLPHAAPLSYLCFSPDGSRLATASGDRVIRIWRVDQATPEQELLGASDRIPQVTFDPNGTRLAGALRSGALMAWDLKSGQYETWRGPTNAPLRTARFSPDGRWLIVAGADRTVDVWDAHTAARVASLVGHNQEIYAFDVSPAGDLIASGDTGGVIRVWHLGLRRPLASLDGHSDPVMDLSFSPDGMSLASASLDGTVRLWDLAYHATHIAGNVESQLARIGGDAIDSARAAAWRDWARGKLHGE